MWGFFGPGFKNHVSERSKLVIIKTEVFYIQLFMDTSWRYCHLTSADGRAGRFHGDLRKVRISKQTSRAFTDHDLDPGAADA